MLLSAGARLAIACCAVAWSLAWTIALAAQASRPARPGLIVGQVVDADSGQPLAEAIVTLFGSVEPVNQSVITDADGRFVFSVAAPASVSLFANASGYLAAHFGQGAPSGPARSLELADGERRGDVKIRLWKYAAITGIVLTETGEAAVGARVQALRRTPTPRGFAYEPAGSATADDRGIYRIGSMGPGSYVIAAPHPSTTFPAEMLDRLMQTVAAIATGTGSFAGLGDVISADVAPDLDALRIDDFLFSTDSIRPPPPLPGGRLQVYRTQFHPQTATITDASIIRLRSGEERSGIDLHLALVTAAAISGTVTGPEGPVPSVVVRLVPASSNRRDAAPLDFVKAVTGADGTFRMLGVPAGQYVASVLKEPPDLPAELISSPMFEAARSMLGIKSMELLFGESAVTVGNADVNDVSIVVRDGLTISGRLQFEGSATQPTAEEMESVQVALTNADSPPTWFMRPAQADQHGAFTTGALPAGKYAVAVWGLPPAWTIRSISVGGRDVTYGAVELSRADVTGVLVVLTDASATVSGTIRSAGASVPLASAVLFPADYTGWIESGMDGRRMRQVAANSRGVYSLDRVPAGEYRLAAVDDAQLDTDNPAFYRALASGALRVTLRASDARTLNLTVVSIPR